MPQCRVQASIGGYGRPLRRNFVPDRRQRHKDDVIPCALESNECLRYGMECRIPEECMHATSVAACMVNKTLHDNNAYAVNPVGWALTYNNIVKTHKYGRCYNTS